MITQKVVLSQPFNDEYNELTNFKELKISVRAKGDGSVASKVHITMSDEGSISVGNGMFYSDASATNALGDTVPLTEGVNTLWLKVFNPTHIIISNILDISSLGSYSNYFVEGTNINAGAEIYGDTHQFRYGFFKLLNISSGSIEGRLSYLQTSEYLDLRSGGIGVLSDINGQGFRLGGGYFGDIGDIGATISTVSLRDPGVSVVFEKGASFNFSNSFSSVYVRADAILSQSQVDDLFISLSNAVWIGNKNLTIKTPTVNTETDLAKDRFISKSVTVTYL